MDDINGWITLISNFGIAFIIIAFIIWLAWKYLPKLIDTYIQSKKDQTENTKALITALNQSTNAIEGSSKVIEKNSEINVQYQNLLSKYSESVIKFTTTTADLAKQVEKGNELNQKVYTEILIVKDKINTKGS